MKRMFQAVDNEVVDLKRLSMWRLQLDEKSKPGRVLGTTQEEIERLKEHA